MGNPGNFRARRLCLLRQDLIKDSFSGNVRGMGPAAAELGLEYAAGEYLEGKASLSELAKKTSLDVPTIMDEIARTKGGEKRQLRPFCPPWKRSRR